MLILFSKYYISGNNIQNSIFFVLLIFAQLRRKHEDGAKFMYEISITKIKQFC